MNHLVATQGKRKLYAETRDPGSMAWIDDTARGLKIKTGKSVLAMLSRGYWVLADDEGNEIKKHYGPGPHAGTGTPQTVHGGKHRGVLPVMVDVKMLERAVRQGDALTPPRLADYSDFDEYERVRNEYDAQMDLFDKMRTVGPETWRRGTVYQLADPDSMGLLEVDEGWRPEFVGTRSKLSTRQKRLMNRLEATVPGITDWLNKRGVSIAFTPEMADDRYAIGEFTVSPHAGPLVWVQTLQSPISATYQWGSHDDDEMFDTLLHEVGHAVDWDGTATVTHIGKGVKFVSKQERNKFKLAGGSVSWNYDYKKIMGLRDWYGGASDQVQAKYRYMSGPPPFATEWFAEGFEHYAKDGTTGNADYDTFIEARLDDFDDLPLKVTVKKAATPSGLTDKEVAELFRLGDLVEIPPWVAEGRNPRSMLKLLRRFSIKDDIKKRIRSEIEKRIKAIRYRRSHDDDANDQ